MMRRVLWCTLLAFGASGAIGAHAYADDQTVSVTVQQSATESPTPTPTANVDPTSSPGPDGTATPEPSSTPVVGVGSVDSGAGSSGGVSARGSGGGPLPHTGRDFVVIVSLAMALLLTGLMLWGFSRHEAARKKLAVLRR